MCYENGVDTMELEISVEDLLNKRKIESDRIEFKTGWNPDDIYHRYPQQSHRNRKPRYNLQLTEARRQGEILAAIF